MTWDLFDGSGEPQRPEPTGDDPPPKAYERLPPLPKWRTTRRREECPDFAMPDGLANAVNTALHLRRPLLLTGSTGTGKSTLMDLLARELEIRPVLRWHITSKSVLTDGLYSYDALDRLNASENGEGQAKVEEFVTLGPLGTALASPDRPRAVLIDEIDKSDLDLPGDLLNILETGEFDIPPLIRAAKRRDASAEPVPYRVRGYDNEYYDVGDGMVKVSEKNYPIIVFTSNRERRFAPPFLRRCIRFEIETPDEDQLVKIVTKHLPGQEDAQRDAIEDFAKRLAGNEELAVNQLIELVHLVAVHKLDAEQEKELRKTLFQDLAER